MLATYDDNIGQSILDILIPSARMYVNKNIIRNVSTTIGRIAEEVAKTVAAQQKSLEPFALVALDNPIALEYLLAKRGLKKRITLVFQRCVNLHAQEQ